jgi:hypothetical protein
VDGDRQGRGSGIFQSCRFRTRSFGAGRIVLGLAGDGGERRGAVPWIVQELDYRFWRLWEAQEYWDQRGGITHTLKPSELFRARCGRRSRAT